MLAILETLLVLVGTVCLVFSLSPAYKLIKLDNHKGWIILNILIVFFILGYFIYVVSIIYSQNTGLLEIMLATILFSGGVFVYLICTVTLSSFVRLRQAINDEYQNSRIDELTGLHTQKFIAETIDETLSTPQEEKYTAALVNINIDRLASIHDTLGRDVCDALLVEVSKRFKACLDDQVTAARVGNDSFLLFLQGFDKAKTEQQIKLLMDSLREPIKTAEHTLILTLSCGASLFPVDSKSRIDMFRHAEIAMYFAKRKHISLAFFNQSTHVTTLPKLKLIQDLRRGVRGKQFELYYQPIFKSDSLEVDAFEALVRWSNTENEMILPNNFLKDAEDAGMIQDITRCIIESAYEGLHTILHTHKSIGLHVNLSILDFDDDFIVRINKELLEKYSLSSDLIDFEINEILIPSDPTQLIRGAQQLKKMGFGISIDHFGKGHTSLSLFKDLPISQIKIDKSFIISMDSDEFSRKMIHSVINLSHAMHVNVAAEGVENTATLSKLRNLSCDFLQGYQFARPMPLNETLHWLKTYNPKSIVK